MSDQASGGTKTFMGQFMRIQIYCDGAKRMTHASVNKKKRCKCGKIHRITVKEKR
jgi:hypothetical protein